MKKAFSLFAFAPLLLAAQETGIKFYQHYDWQGIRSQAKLEKKFIFVDCYASWCEPCKRMDAEVFKNEGVGKYLNREFISVQVQMDTSKQDNSEIKQWYLDARLLKECYKISEFPTYLFFSPDGQLVHKGIGQMNIGKFLSLVANAADSQWQYYTMIHNYRRGLKDYSKMQYFATLARQLNDHTLSDEIATDYIRHLENVDRISFFTKEKLDFVAAFISQLQSSDYVFSLCLHQSTKIDSLEFIGYSDRIVKYVINKEEIASNIAAAKQYGISPDWKRISNTIRRKYGKAIAVQSVVQSKIQWYEYKKDWKHYAKFIVKQVEMNIPQIITPSMRAVVYLNNNAFDVFKYSNDKSELTKALAWVDRALPMLPTPPTTVIDTKANLLYKLGHKSDGIALEKEAASLAPTDKAIQVGYEKMKKGLPTWPIDL